jgi:phenylacetate-CoA ligase
MASKLWVQFQVLQKRREMEQSCRWTPDQLAKHQRTQLSQIRRFAQEQSPFYARFHRGMENRPLEDLPILTKSIVMDNFDELTTDRSIRLSDVESHLKQDDGAGMFRGKYVALSTSGSTGQRGVFLFSSREWVACLASISRPMKWAGVNPNPLRPMRSTMLASTTSWHYSARVGRSLATRLLPTLRLDAGEPVESMVQQLNDWQPRILVAYPSVLRQLAGEQASGRLKIAPQYCATSAEVLTAETRRRVHEAWGVRVFETYGATEYAPIAAECPAGRRHMFEDGAVIENVDERGRPVPPGVTGDSVLLTIFNRRTQPLIRYQISDMLRISTDKCECGRPFRCLEGIEGRQEDVLYFPARAQQDRLIAVHPNVFHRLLETVPAAGWQVVHDDRGITVNLIRLRDNGQGAECSRIDDALRRALEAEHVEVPPIQVSAVSEAQRGKTGKAPLVVNLASKLASRG